MNPYRQTPQTSSTLSESALIEAIRRGSAQIRGSYLYIGRRAFRITPSQANEWNLLLVRAGDS